MNSYCIVTHVCTDAESHVYAHVNVLYVEIWQIWIHNNISDEHNNMYIMITVIIILLYLIILLSPCYHMYV